MYIDFKTRFTEGRHPRALLDRLVFSLTLASGIRKNQSQFRSKLFQNNIYASFEETGSKETYKLYKSLCPAVETRDYVNSPKEVQVNCELCWEWPSFSPFCYRKLLFCSFTSIAKIGLLISNLIYPC